MPKSDIVFAALLVAASDYRTVNAGDVIEAMDEVPADDAPARRTVTTHLNRLSELGVLERVDDTRWRFVERFDPS